MEIKYYMQSRIRFIAIVLCACLSLLFYTLSGYAQEAKEVEEDASYADLSREYVITYHLNGGANQANPAVYHEGEVLSLEPPVRTGYTFLGWYDNAAFSGELVSTVTTSAGGLHFYAKWERQVYKIYYKYNGGKAMGSNPSSFQYQSSAKRLYPAGKKGYQFLGWYRTDTNKLVYAVKGNIHSDITLSAHFKKLTVKKGKGVSVKRTPNVLVVKISPQKDVAGYELQYWKKGGKKTALTGDVTRYQLLKFSKTEDYSFRVRCFQYDSTGSKVYGAYSKVVTSKGEKPKEDKKKAEKSK